MRQLKISRSITNRESISLEKYLQEIAKYDLVTADEEVELARRVRMEGDNKAKEILTRSNLRFVVSVAKQYQNQGLSLTDLISEGNLGLMKAVERFDETRGFKFISYAVWWIRQTILQAISEQSRIVKYPQNQINTFNKSNKCSIAFEQKFERMPTLQELAEIMETPIEKLSETIRGINKHVSFDAPLTNDSESNCLLDVMECGSALRCDHNLIKESLDYEIQRALSSLTEREKIIIKMMYGIGTQEVAVEVIGKRLNLTNERIRQICKHALIKLRESDNQHLLKAFLG